MPPRPRYTTPGVEAFQAGHGPTRLSGTLASLAKDAETFLHTQQEAQDAQLAAHEGVEKLNIAFHRLSEYVMEELGALQKAQRAQSEEAARQRAHTAQELKALKREVEALQVGGAGVGSKQGDLVDRATLRHVELQMHQELQELRDVCSAVRRFAEQQASTVRALALQAQAKAEEASRGVDAHDHKRDAMEMSMLEARQELAELREQCAALTLEQAELRRAVQQAEASARGQGAASLRVWEPSWLGAEPAWEGGAGVESLPRTPNTTDRLQRDAV